VCGSMAVRAHRAKLFRRHKQGCADERLDFRQAGRTAFVVDLEGALVAFGLGLLPTAAGTLVAGIPQGPVSLTGS
jgi:hypothetical protein